MTVNTSKVLIEKVGLILKIGINRPNQKNLIDSETSKLLINAFKAFESDDKLHVAVLYGTGGNFCAGYDLDELPKVTNSNNLIERLGELNKSIGYVQKPVVGAINGYATSGGLELALMCDLRVMEETAVMGVSERHRNVPMVNSGAVRLQEIIGLPRALDLVLSGRTLSAKEALEYGLANRIVACGTAIGQAFNLAKSVAKFPQECLKVDKAAVYGTLYEKLKDFERNNVKNVEFCEPNRNIDEVPWENNK